MIKSIVVIAAVAACASLVEADSLWPKPTTLTTETGVRPVSSAGFKFTYQGSNDVLKSGISRYEQITFIQYTSVNPATGSAGTDLSELVITIDDQNATLPNLDTDESYKLSIPKTGSATLYAATAFGALHGLETFSQLVDWTGQTGQFQVGLATVIDAPRFQHRGVMIDTARHFLPLSIIKAFIDAMIYTKMNVLHWHLVDDQSFPYVSEVYPLLSSKGAYNAPDVAGHTYSKQDLAEVVEYARLRGVRVIPEFDTPGHTGSWGIGYPELLTPCYQNGKPDGVRYAMNPSLNSTFDFLHNLFAEVKQRFPDQFVHIGGDEVGFTCWASNPDINAFMAEQGIAAGDYVGLETYYEQRLTDDLTAQGSSYVAWQELFDNGVKLPDDTVVHVWKSGWQEEMATVTAGGFKTLLSSPFYLNYISYGEDWPTYYDIEPLNFTATDKQKSLVMGGEACMWAEFVDSTNLISRTWPRACAVAERFWSPEDTRDITDATNRLHAHRCRLLHRGITAEPPSGPSFCPQEFVPTYQPFGSG